MPYSNPVVNGTALAVPAIKSPNYIPGLQGWAIFRDGSAEFASGTFRGPVVVVEPGTGAILASIGATGNGSFQNVAVTTDILLGTTSLLDLTTRQGRGLVASIGVSGALPSSGNNVFTDTAWIEFSATAGRMYRISTTPIETVNPGGPVGVDQVQFRLTLSSPNGGFAGAIYSNRDDVDEQSTMIATAVFTAAVTAVQRVQLATLGVGVVMTYPNTNDSFVFTVDDIGATASAGHTGGAGTASGASQYTVKYVCTASRTYQGDNTPSPSPDADNNLYMGQLNGRSFGTEKGLWIFPGNRIRTDLTGATVQAATLFMYCFDCNGTSGDLRLSWQSDSVLPATAPSTTAPELNVDNVFPVPGWGSRSILGTHLNEILNNGRNSARMGIGVFEDPTAWRGFGFSAAFRPYIEITYTSNTPPSPPPGSFVATPMKSSRIIPKNTLPPGVLAKQTGARR